MNSSVQSAFEKWLHTSLFTRFNIVSNPDFNTQAQREKHRDIAMQTREGARGRSQDYDPRNGT
jgi:hypothetical protein